MKDPSARTLSNIREVMGQTPHRSVRHAEGQPYVFMRATGEPALVTREDACRLINLGLLRMVRLTDADGWEYVLSGIGSYTHLGEHLAAVATFTSIHKDPTLRHRYGEYPPPPKPIDEKVVVSVWQGKDLIKTTALPRRKAHGDAE